VQIRRRRDAGRARAALRLTGLGVGPRGDAYSPSAAMARVGRRRRLRISRELGSPPMTPAQLRGVYVPLVTPFDDDGSIDFASLAVVPYYVRPSEAAIVAHFDFVAQRSPVPLVVYNIPYRTGRGLGAAALLELAAIPGIAGLKQAVGSLDADTLTVLANAPADFAVLGGGDAFLAPLVLMGGAGAIAASAHVCTDRFVAMIDAALAGDAARARPHAEALLPLVLALFAAPSPASVKA